MKYPYNVNYCRREQQERMLRLGWKLKIARNVQEELDGDALYTRLLEEGYEKVRVYYDTTAIRGFHCNFAFVK